MKLVLFTNAMVSSRRLIVVRWMLCLAIAATMLAFGIKTFRGDGTALNAFLFLEWGWSNERAARVENAALWIVLALTGLGILGPYRWLLLPAGLYLLLEAVLSIPIGGKPFSDLTPAAAALRFGTPLFTPLLLAGYRRGSSLPGSGPPSQPARSSDGSAWRQRQTRRSGAILLRLATGVVFLAHGYEAWRHHPNFIDLVIGTGHRQLGIWFDESQVTRALSVIGAVDIMVGLGLLVSGNRLLLAWAAAWGLVTALSRVTSFGWGAYAEVLYRAPHFLVPLALLLLVWDGSSKTKPVKQGGDDECRPAY